MSYLFKSIPFVCSECGNIFTTSGGEQCAGVVIPLSPCPNCGSKKAMPFTPYSKATPTMQDMYRKLWEKFDDSGEKTPGNSKDANKE